MCWAWRLGCSPWPWPGSSSFCANRPLRAQISKSPPRQRLSWLAAQTSSRDLVIGDTVNDIPYFFDRQAAVSFSPYPYTILLTPSTLDDLADQYCPSYANLYLVLRKRELSDPKLRQLFGRYVANLWGADLDKYPELELITDLPDSRIFRLKFCVTSVWIRLRPQSLNRSRGRRKSPLQYRRSNDVSRCIYVSFGVI